MLWSVPPVITLVLTIAATIMDFVSPGLINNL